MERFVGRIGSVSVVDCTFVGNAAMHAGAGLLVFVDAANPTVSVTGCRFIDNAAGSVDMDAFAAYADEFQVHDNEVRSHRVPRSDPCRRPEILTIRGTVKSLAYGKQI